MRSWRPTASLERNAGTGLSVFQAARSWASFGHGCAWHLHQCTTSLGVSHVGRPNHPAISEPEHQPFRFLLDAEQPIVNQLMMGATEGEQVLLAVSTAVLEVLQMVDVQPKPVGAARHLAAVLVAVEHGPARGWRDGAGEMASPVPLPHLQDLGVAACLAHVGLRDLGFWRRSPAAVGAVFDHHAEALTCGGLGAVQFVKHPGRHLSQESAVSHLFTRHTCCGPNGCEKGPDLLGLHWLHGEAQPHGPGLLDLIPTGRLTRPVRGHDTLEHSAGGLASQIHPLRFDLGGDHGQQLASLGPTQRTRGEGLVQQRQVR